MVVLNEAFRLNMMPSLSEFKSGAVTIDILKQKLKVFSYFLKKFEFLNRNRKNRDAIKIWSSM